jgi:hypothetical protein
MVLGPVLYRHLYEIVAVFIQKKRAAPYTARKKRGAFAS